MANSSEAPLPSPQARQPIPTYQSLAAVNVGNFVSYKLSGSRTSSNYSTWKLQMLSLFESHDLLGVIDGRVPAPRPNEATEEGDRWKSIEEYDAWRTDKVVRGWIIGGLADPSLVNIVANLGTAQEVWLQLAKAFSEQETPSPVQPQAVLEKDYFKIQIPLLKAALSGDWAAAQQILKSDPGAASTWIDNDNILTPLEAAVGTGKAIHFVENLLACIHDDERVALKNDLGSSSLHIAAAVGNKAAAALLVGRMPSLCYRPDNYGDFPIQYAARYAQRNTLQYMITVTKDDTEPNPYQGMAGLRLLTYAIDAEFLDIALYLVDKYPYLVTVGDDNYGPALVQIVTRSVLSNKRRFNFWERYISRRIPAEVIERSNSMIRMVPRIRTIVKKARAHDQALELVKLICDKLRSSSNFREARNIYEEAILKAAELGLRDVVEIIMDIIPLSIYAFRLPSGQYIFHEAVENRCDGVFNLIYQMSDHRHIFSNIKDSDENNLLHLAGKLAPAQKLNEISGATLQMQREIQWFKEVEKFVHPYAREEKNTAGKTPQQMFTDEHKDLKEVGEKWMKDTANSCTISAALIATVMFAAAITVPGGNHQETGYPMFSHDAAFIIFAVSDAISLFTSATSLLLFLAILTSRYAEEDFLRVLPKRLIFGLATLFLSITFMMISFSATLYLVFGRKKAWVLFPVLVFASLPVTSFALLQFPLMIDLISCTYFPSIFGKKSNRPFY